MMTRNMLALSFGFAVLILVTQQGYAQTAAPGAQCADRAKVVDHLATKYGETRRSIGLAANNAVMEVYASDATGSWTITVTMPSGVTCLVASGQGYEAMADTLPAKGSDV